MSPAASSGRSGVENRERDGGEREGNRMGEGGRQGDEYRKWHNISEFFYRETDHNGRIAHVAEKDRKKRKRKKK